MRTKGFSLIELMIAVVIVGILGAIAFPSYENAMMRSRRSDGQLALMNMASHMERFYTTNNTYTGATSPAAIGMPDTSPEGFYNLSVTSVTANTFTISAAPTGAQASDTCGTLSLTNTNIRTPTTDGCW